MALPPDPVPGYLGETRLKLYRCLAATLLIAVTGGCGAEALSGRIVAISDGDSLTFLDAANQQHKIRLSGIDAPERRQPFGERARANLAAQAFNRPATADCPKQDRYGRAVCVVSVDGQDVGQAQVASGLAWWYRQYAREQSPQAREAYEAAETEARARRLGLWSAPDPIPPWEWRRARRH